MPTKPTVFIGSSTEGLEIAQAIGEEIKSYADTVIWNENVFDYGRGYLEELMCELDKHDFAVLVMSPDDIVESRDNSSAAPRDNVLFEAGLFMGRLGRDRTFIVCDKDKATKLPSDFAGVSLATYDGARVSENLKSAVRGSCGVISRAIKKPEFWQLAGEWKSRYRFAYDDDEEEFVEEVEIRPARGKICIESKMNPKDDHYIAYGSLHMDKHLVGKWESSRKTASSGGVFMLTLHPMGNILFGYFVMPDDDYKILHATWVLAKKAGATEDQVLRLLDRGEKLLKETSQFLQQPLAPPVALSVVVPPDSTGAPAAPQANGSGGVAPAGRNRAKRPG